jgi:hypothetical protein
VKRDNPDASFGELGKLIGVAWHELDEDEKNVSRITLHLLSLSNPSRRSGKRRPQRLVSLKPLMPMPRRRKKRRSRRRKRKRRRPMVQEKKRKRRKRKSLKAELSLPPHPTLPLLKSSCSLCFTLPPLPPPLIIIRSAPGGHRPPLTQSERQRWARRRRLDE